jgi:RND family efflux transporter MFP subunit
MRLLYLILLFFILPHLAMASGMPSRKVTIATAIMQEVYDGYEGIAESKNSSSRDFYAQSAGVITDVITKQGSLVKKGDIILKINGPLAEAQYQSATKTLQRSKTLLAKKIIADAAFENAKTAFENARKIYENMVIIAPFDGKIGVIEHEVGDQVNIGNYLVSITSGAKAEFLVTLPEKLINIIKDDTKVQIWHDGNYHDGVKVSAISPYISKESGGFSVKITSTTDTDKITHNSFTKIKFFLNAHNALTIPEKSVMKNDIGNFVFLVSDDNIVKQTYVTLGYRLDGKIEVISGLKEDDKVILEGLTNVYDGSTVEVL